MIPNALTSTGSQLGVLVRQAEALAHGDLPIASSACWVWIGSSDKEAYPAADPLSAIERLTTSIENGWRLACSRPS